MQVEILKQIEGKLLYGGKAEIAKMAGVSKFTVIRFFKNDGTRRQNKKVLMAISEYLKEVDTSIEQLTTTATA